MSASEDKVWFSKLVRRSLYDSARLRVAIGQNDLDYSSAGVPGTEDWEIVYIFDAQVVGMFLTPDVKPFNSIGIFREDEQDTRFGQFPLESDQIATATITAEFLFSRRLVGQKRRPYISAGHMLELNNMIDSIRTDHRNALAKAGATGAMSDRVYQLLKPELAPELSDVERLERITNEFATHVGTLVLGRAPALAALERIIEEDLLSPAETLAEFDDAVAGVNEADFNKWCELIANAKGYGLDDWTKYDTTPIGRLYQRGAGGGVLIDVGSVEKISADAETICQVIALNRYAYELGLKRRFLMVTADAGIHWASQEWAVGNTNFESPLRHTIQYIPLLNYVEMEGLLNKKKYFAETRRALDSFLLTVFPDAPGTSAGLTSFLERVLQDNGRLEEYLVDSYQLRASQVLGELEELRKVWRTILQNAITANFRLIDRRAAGLVASVRRAVSEHGSMFALEESHDRALRDLTGLYLMLGLWSSLPRAVRRAARNGAKDPFSNRRTPIATAIDFTQLTNQRALGRYLDSLLSPDTSPQLLAHLDERFRSAPRALVMALAACIALRIGAWSSVANYCRQARIELKHLRSEEERRELERVKLDQWELSYLEGLARRVQLANERDYDVALWAVNRSVQHYGEKKEVFFQLRSLSERAALNLSFCYRFTFDARPGADVEVRKVDLALRMAIDDLAKARNQFDREEDRDEGLSKLYRSRADEIDLQLWTNIASAFVFDHLRSNAGPSFGARTEGLDRNLAQTALNRIEPYVATSRTPIAGTPRRGVSYLVHLKYWVLSIMILEGAALSEAIRKLRGLLELLKEYEKVVDVDRPVPSADLFQVGVIGRWLEQNYPAPSNP